LSTDTCTELTETVSEAVPETVTLPETVALFAGEAMATETTGLPTLTERLAEAEWEAVSVTWTVKGKEPAEVGVPEMVPAELSVRPVGREPLARDQA